MFDIFKTAENSDFFSILARPNKELYWAVINMLYDEVMSIYERCISRSEAKFLIEKLIAKYNAEKDKNEECAMEPYAFLSVFIETGWLVQRYNGEEGDDFLFFTPFAFNFIKSMEDYHNGGNMIQTADCLERIHDIAEDILEQREDSDAYKYPFRSGLQKIITLLGDCFYQLSNIDYQMSENVKEILDTKNLQELIDKLTVYIDDLNRGYIHDVYDSFNLTELHRKRVLQLIEKIEQDDDLRQKVLVDMNERYKVTANSLSESELSSTLTSMLTTLENKIKVAYPSYKDRIDNNVQNVISKSLHKMNILSEGGSSHLATLNRVIEMLSFVADKEMEDVYSTTTEIADLFENSINNNKMRVVTENSLFKKREMSPKEEMEPVVFLEDNEDFDLADFEMEHFSLEDANKYSKELLGSLSEINVKDIFFDDDDLITKLQAVCLMSDEESAEYELVFTGERTYKDGYEFDEFIIKKIG
jgi:hypothetical protein